MDVQFLARRFGVRASWFQVYGGRWQYWSPLDVYRPWLPRVQRGSDEYGNPSAVIVVPPFGALVVFYGRGFQRERYWCPACDGLAVETVRGGEVLCGTCGAFLTYTEEALADECA